jgi:hypothetical protein
MSVPADLGYGLVPFYQMLIRDISPPQKRDIA